MLWFFPPLILASFHDASHFAVSSNWLVNAAVTYIFPYFSSPLTWYYQVRFKPASSVLTPRSTWSVTILS
jgi:hypothetical protein